MIVPPAIIQVNSDISTNVLEMLSKQLHITEVITGDEFDTRIASNSEYYSDYKKTNSRLLVLRPADNTNNRESVDLVCFIKAGLITIEENKNGPHGLTWPVVNIGWGKLNIF